MKLIVLRGDKHQGKTTTIRLVYDILLFEGAKITTPRTPGRNTDDFETILEHNNQRIAICSAGDVLYNVVANVNKFARMQNIDVLIIASRPFASLHTSIGSFHPIYRDKLQKNDVNNVEDARFIRSQF